LGVLAVAEIVAFTTEHICRLTGLSTRQVRYWDDTEFFSPTMVEGFRGRAFGRIYSFRDLVGLRVIAVLRKKIPLQELRRVGAWLKKHHQQPWSRLKFALAGRVVVFYDPITGVPTEAKGEGQTVLKVALEPIADEMREAAERLRERAPSQIGQIVRNRYVVHNAWTVGGTRVPTDAIWNFHQAGYDTVAIVREYPRLTAKDVEAAIEFEGRRRNKAA
jgi:DNA-binding transcriptional MerR regulator